MLPHKDDQSFEIFFRTGYAAIKKAIECTVSVYGNARNYANPKALNAQYVEKCVKQGITNVFVGMLKNGTPVATVSAKKTSRFEKAWEVCTLAVREKYRGFHLGRIILHHLIDFYKESGATLYAHAVMFYSFSEKTIEESGFVPTGFLCGVCDAAKHLSQLNSHSKKHTWAVYVTKNGTVQTDTLYVPVRLKDLVYDIYETLGLFPVIDCNCATVGKASRVEHEQDDYHKTLYLYVMVSGEDLQESIQTLEKQYADELQTFIVYLNINDKTATYGFKTLEKSGYDFSGLKPICGDCEYVIFSKTDGVYIDCAELQMTDMLRRLYERIRK